MEGENFVRVLDNFITDIDNSFPEFDIKNIVPYIA